MSILNPTRTSPHNRNNNNNSFKYKLDCQAQIDPENPDTKEWLILLEQIKHNSSDYKLFIGLLEKYKKIVIKIGTSSLDKEFQIGLLLETLKLPTFLSYHCIFSCLDNFKELNITKSLCKKKGEKINILVMPYISEGQIDKFNWNREHFSLLKNVLYHITLTVLYSSLKTGFIHRDLHLGNIMIKKTRKQTINYNEFGKISNKTYSNSLVTRINYDVLGRISNLQTGSVQNLNYSYDPVGNYEKSKYNCAGSAGHLIQPFLDRLKMSSVDIHCVTQIFKSVK
jgi:serine/threonine protein kinase